MKFVLLALVACSSLALLVKADKVHGREGHVSDLRERLGHFRHRPYTDLYKFYALTYVMPFYPGRNKDDYRNYMPSGSECMMFFRNYFTNKGNVKELDKMVILDACLGYLFENEYQEQDIETNNVDKDNLAALRSNEELQKLYNGTKINELGDQVESCIGDLLVRVILARHDYPDVTCNHHFLQAYLQFAECQKELISPEQRESDSYLKIIYELLKQNAKSCFEVEIESIRYAMRDAYRVERLKRAKLYFKHMYSPLSKQQMQRMIPTPVVRLMAAVQNTTSEINDRSVHELVRGYYEKDTIIIGKFFGNIAYYADKTLKPSSTDPSVERHAPQLYNKLIDDMCKFFRSSDSDSEFDYATPMIRMVELINYPELFDLTPEYFKRRVLINSEIAQLYLGLSACNVLTFTEAVAVRVNARKKSKWHYKVMESQDTSKMVKWLDAGYY